MYGPDRFDNVLGLGGLLSTFLRWEAIEELEIYGGRTALDRVHDLLYGVVLRGNQPPMPLQFRELKPGMFFEAKDFTISAIPSDPRFMPHRLRFHLVMEMGFALTIVAVLGAIVVAARRTIRVRSRSRSTIF